MNGSGTGKQRSVFIEFFGTVSHNIVFYLFDL